MKNLKDIYLERFDTTLLSLANGIEQELIDYLKEVDHIDRIYARPKSVDRFLRKAEKIEAGVKKYTDPIHQIQDQVGARIITFYLDDVELVTSHILKYYRPIEQHKIIPDSDKEFGYEGQHFILIIPSDLIPDGIDKNLIPTVFELQIKTLYQHAFSEASHDLAYKQEIELTKDQKRRVAFTAAQSWGADLIFNGLKTELIK